MGTNSSNSKDEKKLISNNDDGSSVNWDVVSSYKGMKSENSSAQGKNKHSLKSSSVSNVSEQVSNANNNNNNNNNYTNEENPPPIDDRVPYKFVWKNGGNKVTITGSFLNNWTNFIEMVKNPENNFFEINFNLPRIKHQFKFIIDGNWRCSSDYPQINDGQGNTNNEIDLSNFVNPEIEKKREEEEKKKKQEIERKNEEKKFLKLKKNDYNCYSPNKNEMNTDVPKIPHHYAGFYNIDKNTFQDIIGKSKCLQYKEKNLLSENICYKKVLIAPHVNLNHCCVSLNCSKEKKYLRTCISQRFKHKFVTIVYYNNNNENENDGHEFNVDGDEKMN